MADTKIPLKPMKRTFPLKLKPVWTRQLEFRLFWLRAMLWRLGKDATLAVWHDAFRAADDGLLDKILASGWKPCAEGNKKVPSADQLLASFFPSQVEGIDAPTALKLVEHDRFFSASKKRFPDLLVRNELTAYATIHMTMDGGARLVESMTRRLSKEGELVAYDIIRDWRKERSAQTPMKVADLMRVWADVNPKVPNIFSAGLEMKVIKVSDKEVASRVTACEWARYFSERHPTVGYLVSCSTDDAAVRAMNGKVRMRRTSTIMGGGKVCDFRIYAVT